MFGRFRKDKRYARLAREAQAELAAFTEIDRAPLREALAAPSRRAGGLATAVRELPTALALRRGAVPEPIPQSTDDTMIVSSPVSWYAYQRTAAFICEPGRVLRPVRFVAYSVDGQLQREIPRIIAIRDAVPFDSAEQRRLMWSGTELDLRLADVIATTRRLGLAAGAHQVYLLTAPGQAGHITLPADVARRAWRRRPLRLASRHHELAGGGRLRLGGGR